MNTNYVKCILLGLTMCTSAFAQQNTVTTTTVEESQDKHKVETNYFFDNWFVGAGGGTNLYFGTNDSKLSLSKRLGSTFNVYAGKWFTPGIGLRLGVDLSQSNGLTLNNSNWYEQYYNTGETYVKDGVTYYKQKIKYGNLNAQAMFNLSNLLAGYNPYRFYNIIPYAGLGLMWSTNKGGSHEHELAVIGGILNTFRLNDAVNLTFDLKGGLFNEQFSHKRVIDINQSGARDFTLAASVGVVYKFKRRGWGRSKTITNTIKYSDEELKVLRDRVNELEKANRDLAEQAANGTTVVDTRIEKNIQSMPLLITFPINKSTVSNDARVNLGFLAKVIKENPGSVFTITGYADKGTGTKTINERLSRARANAVYDTLVGEFGVSSSQLRTSSEGGVDDMYYDDPRLSRAVITKAK